MISLIAAVDEAYGLGKNNSLLCHLPADLQYFKAVTMGKPIIMGRKTLESIGRALPGRQNLVLSHKSQILMPHVQQVSSLEEALALVVTAPEIVIIGGASVFSQAFAFASRIYLTKIHQQFPADVFFPHLDEHVWKVSTAIFRPQDAHNPYDMTFYIYER